MTCPFCNGETIAKIRAQAAAREDVIVIVKNLPARVCQSCGETIFSEEVKQKLDTLYARMEEIVQEADISSL